MKRVNDEFRTYFGMDITIDDEILMNDIHAKTTYYWGKIIFCSILTDNSICILSNGKLAYHVGDVVSINEDNFT